MFDSNETHKFLNLNLGGQKKQNLSSFSKIKLETEIESHQFLSSFLLDLYFLDMVRNFVHFGLAIVFGLFENGVLFMTNRDLNIKSLPDESFLFS